MHSVRIPRPVLATNQAGAVVWRARYTPLSGIHSVSVTPDTLSAQELRFPGQWFAVKSDCRGAAVPRTVAQPEPRADDARPRQNQNRSIPGVDRGFALLTVLFGLAVVAVLVAAAMGPTLAHVRLLGHGARQGAQAALIAGALEAVGGLTAAQARDASTGEATFDLALGAHRVRVVRRDVAGLIDINTAAPDLLARFFVGHGLPETLTAAVTDLRTNRRVIARLTDLPALLPLSPEQTERIAPFLTIYSGHPGIAPDHAPMALLEALAGRRGSREALARALPDAWLSPAGGRVQALDIQLDGTEGRAHRAVIQLTSGRGYRLRILEAPL